jgi:hypothetical protein
MSSPFNRGRFSKQTNRHNAVRAAQQLERAKRQLEKTTKIVGRIQRKNRLRNFVI